MKLPKARTKAIVVQNLKDEILVYDLSINRAFCLNDVSAKVFNACDGKQTLADLKAEYQLTDEIIHLALDALKRENVLDGEYVLPFAGLSRREVIKKVGLTSLIALPVISSLVAPNAISAASPTCTTTRPYGQGTCPVNQRCINGDCFPCVQPGQPSPSGCTSTTVAACCSGGCTPGNFNSGTCNQHLAIQAVSAPINLKIQF